MKNTLVIILLAVSFSTLAQEDQIYSNWNGAIKGYDPVAYFTMGEAVKGKESFTTNWKEADWYFASKENLEAFKANPKKYAPQFGGYCAYGVSKGALYKIDPEAWKIVDNKLYLNYSKSIQEKWEENPAAFIKEAESNWPKVIE